MDRGTLERAAVEKAAVEKGNAWGVYRSAFEDFSHKAQYVQFLTSQPNPDHNEMDAALLQLEKSRVAYRDSRDAVVQRFLPAMPNAPATNPGNVSTIAELLWESAGRPEGTAHKDWLRAEAIVRCSVA